jgi:serine/threonine protein kinase
MLLSDKYKINGIITKGTYSTLYEGEHIIKKHKVAIKIESDEICKKLLDNEIKMYLHLNRGKTKLHIPDIKCIGTYDNYSYIVMELLDINLKQYVAKGIQKYKFLMIMEQLFILIEMFHYRGLVHRDIKPENFVFNKAETLCIIDLGLSTFISNREMKKFIGNKRYSSYSCHLDKYIYTVKDDLISIIYMLLDLYTKILPWDYNQNKKDVDFEKFYKEHHKYDDIVEVILYVYSIIGTKHFYVSVMNELRSAIYHYHS